MTPETVGARDETRQRATNEVSATQVRSTYSVGQFARTLGVGEMTVYRAIHAGRLPAIKFAGRYLIPAKALDDLIEAAMSRGFVDISDRASAQNGVA